MRARPSSKRTHGTRREASPKLVVLKVLGNTAMRVTEAGRAKCRSFEFRIELVELFRIGKGKSPENFVKFAKMYIALTLAGEDPLDRTTWCKERDLHEVAQFCDDNNEEITEYFEQAREMMFAVAN